MMAVYLTADERAELDALMFEAGCTSDGRPRPSHEIGERVVAALRTAANQAHRAWARAVLDDIAEAGSLTRWKSWHKRKVVIDLGETAGENTVVTTKAAAMSIKRRNDHGEAYYQATFWSDMTRDQLQQVIDRASLQAWAESKTIVLARTLLALLDKVPTANTAAEAAAALGMTINDWLGEPEVRSA